MADLMIYNDDFGKKPEQYTKETIINELKDAHVLARKLDARIAVYSGIRIRLLCDEFHYGEFGKLYKELDISDETARNYINIAEAFEKNPECLDGIGIRKALTMIKPGNEERIVQFMSDGIWRGPDGCIMTTAQIKEMTSKEFDKQYAAEKRQKAKELSEWRDRALNGEIEFRALQEDNELLEKSLNNKDEAMAILRERDKKKEELLKQVRAEKDEMFLQLQEKEREKVEGEKALEMIRNLHIKAVDLFGDLNQIVLSKPDEVASDYLGLLKRISLYLDAKYQYFTNNVGSVEE